MISNTILIIMTFLKTFIMTFIFTMIILLVTFAVRIEEGVGPRLRRPHRLQPLGLHHPGEDNMVTKLIIKVVIRVIKVVEMLSMSLSHLCISSPCLSAASLT